VVVEEGRRLLYAAEQLELKARRIQSGWEAELRICIDEILPFSALWPLVHAFYGTNMDTRLRLSTEVLAGSWDALIARRADLIVGAAGEPPQLPNIVTRPRGEMRHVFAVAPGHPLASQPEPLTMADVALHRAAVISDTSRELPPRTIDVGPGQQILAVPSLTAKLSAQCEGLAVGSLPACVAERAITQGKLVVRTVAGMREVTPCYLAWRDDEMGKALNWWIERLDRPDLIQRFTESC
jgi:DNA-binding transcriptional LysR family regulator